MGSVPIRDDGVGTKIFYHALSFFHANESLVEGFASLYVFHDKHFTPLVTLGVKYLMKYTHSDK